MFHFALKNQDHCESVYNLVQPTEREKRRNYYPGQYVSRYACKVRQDAWCRKSGAYKTMGIPSIFLNQPHNFLKKFSGAQPCFWKDEESRPAPSPLKPKSCLVNNNKNCTCCCHPNGVQDQTPRVKASQSERCQKTLSQNTNLMITNNTRGSHSQPLLARNVSCQTEDYSRNSCDNTDRGGGDDCYDDDEFEEDDCLKFGQELLPPPCCSCGGADESHRPKRIPISYNGGLAYIESGKKDFIRDNALAVMRQQAKIPECKIVDAPKGHTNNWVPRQLLGQAGFGRVPRYIKRVKCELYQKDMEMKEAVRRSQNKCRALSEQERAMILKGLEMHWKEIFADYQRIPLYSLSPKLEKKKAELEARLKGVESDLQLFNRNGPLFVADLVSSQYL